ncbi:MAG TPA: hypothetical protein DDZ88_21560 [Verrucomicrobiales bacterium]|nr:hypothetical protein [Verrucomicrobiales bacterium]
MSVISERLDQKLKSLPPAKAASVERLVWDVLQVVDFQASEPASRAVEVQQHEAHVSRCLEMASALDWSEFERPEQGVSEKREDW